MTQPDRRARIRKYKETRRPAGVFRVRNTKTGRVLIGSAFEFEVVDLLEASEEAGYDPADDLKVLKEMWVQKLADAGDELHSGSLR